RERQTCSRSSTGCLDRRSEDDRGIRVSCLRRLRDGTASHGMASIAAAILLSGGMDSIALTYRLRPQLAITIDYGQLPAAGEVRAAAAVCEALDIRHEVIRADLQSLGSGDLVGGPPLAIAPIREWWPFRNQMLITLAAMHVVREDIRHLLLGTVK